MRPLLSLLALTLTACVPAMPPAAEAAYLDGARQVWDVYLFGAWVNVSITAVGFLIIMLALTLTMLKVSPALGNALVNGARYWATAGRYRMQAELLRLHRVQTAGGASALDSDGENLTLALLQDAERVAGADSLTIPGWRELSEHGAAAWQWDSRSWQEAIAPLREFLVIRDGGGGGTVIKQEYGSLAQFARVVQSTGILAHNQPPYPTQEGRGD